ncbi:MAG: hypothetical protein JWP06_328 [Candidatus Saccharibacteria bacterium]|nr:hypothetical protein [Candidatus Saccharibacteria bacterium]
MKVFGRRILISCVVIGGVAWLVWRFARRRVRADITLPPSTDHQVTALFALSLLEQARAFSPEARQSLILQLIQIGYLPDISKSYAEPERFEELLVVIRRRTTLPETPPP